MTKTVNKRPRGRPVSFDREQVLNAAILVFWERGYEGASMDALAKAMGINKPSLYSSFGNKRKLFDAAIDRYAATSGEREFGALQRAGDPKTAVEDFLKTSIESATQRGKPLGCMIVNVATEAAECDAELRSKLAVMYEQTDEGIASRFRRDQEAGLLPEGHDPEALAEMVHSVIHSIKVRARAGASCEQLQKIANNFIAVLFPGHAEDTSA